MKKRLWTAILLTIGLAALAVSAQDDAASLDPAVLERARAAAKALGSELMKKLAAEMTAGGPAAAVKVCSEVAQDVAAAHSTDGLTIRRVSLKARNPADRPDAFEHQQLVALEQRLRDGRELPEEVVKVVEEEGVRKARYLRPIVVQELCLRCHGDADSLDPEVRDVVQELYPDDEATGYEAGDLRGAVSVTIVLGGGA